ncbi:FUSC family protein [Streptomyces sp. NPDC016675]|uniref:FUSC family protein n=1 Tax=Streptomyces sp. NPDC016675 TaxID=3364970 RepID=UPI003701A784
MGVVVVGDADVAAFAVFGVIASLILTEAPGTRLAQSRAHFLLGALGGSLVVLGCLAALSPIISVAVTFVLTFLVFCLGISDRHRATSSRAVLLGYVLAAASPASWDAAPARLGGWCLGVGASIAVTFLFWAPALPDPFVGTVARAMRQIADDLSCRGTGAGPRASDAADDQRTGLLLSEFTAGTYQTASSPAERQVLADVVGTLLWLGDLVAQTAPFRESDQLERELAMASGTLLRGVAESLEREKPPPDVSPCTRLIALCQRRLDTLDGQPVTSYRALDSSFYALAVAQTVLAIAEEARQTQAASLRPTARGPRERTARLPSGGRVRQLLRGMLGRVPAGGVESVWLADALRAAAAMSATLAVVHLVDVDLGFWALLGVLAALRSSVTFTGAAALRTVAGTGIGAALGTLLIICTHGHSGLLWALLPVIVLVTAYSPGVLPDVVSQAGFSLTVLTAYTLISPLGWQLALLRLQDVAIGVGISLLIGAAIWPRGAGAILRRNLADVLRLEGADLTAAAGWALGLVPDRPMPQATFSSLELRRMRAALRSYLAEPRRRGLEQADLWRIVSTIVCLRMTAAALVRLSPVVPTGDGIHQCLHRHATQLAACFAAFGEQIACRHGSTCADAMRRTPDVPIHTPLGAGRAWWVAEYLRHLDRHALALAGLCVRASWKGTPFPLRDKRRLDDTEV